MASADKPANLTGEERHLLLSLARDSVSAAAANKPLPQPDLQTLPAKLAAEGACFVTLLRGKELRGCTGTLYSREPLAREVIQTAAQTALHDWRFFPVSPDEVGALTIEISVLTPATHLAFDDPRDLPRLIRPHVDGVTLFRGNHRATFLPQVWEKIPDPIQFLDQLCMKMELPARAWTQPGIQAEVYQVEEFREAKPGRP